MYQKLFENWRAFQKVIKEDVMQSEEYGGSFDEMRQKIKEAGDSVWIFFDTETTGLKPEKDYAQVTQVAAIAVDVKNFDERPVVLGTFDERISLGERTKGMMAWEKKKEPEFEAEKAPAALQHAVRLALGIPVDEKASAVNQDTRLIGSFVGARQFALAPGFTSVVRRHRTQARVCAIEFLPRHYHALLVCREIGMRSSLLTHRAQRIDEGRPPRAVMAPPDRAEDPRPVRRVGERPRIEDARERDLLGLDLRVLEVDVVDRVAQGHARPQVEGQGDRRELPLVGQRVRRSQLL